MSKPPGLPTPKCAANSGLSEVTRAVRAGIECDDASGCVVPPLHLTSTFAFRAFGEKRTYDYTRSGNPDARPARAGARRARAGRRRRGDRERHGRRHGVRLPHPGRGAHRGAARLLRRHLPAVRGLAPPRRAAGGVRGFWRRGGAARGAVAAHRAPVDRDAEQSAAAHHRHRRLRGAGARRRGADAWSTTPSCRRPGSSRWPSGRTSWCTRPRSTSTATATWWAGR